MGRGDAGAEKCHLCPLTNLLPMSSVAQCPNQSVTCASDVRCPLLSCYYISVSATSLLNHYLCLCLRGVLTDFAFVSGCVTGSEVFFGFHFSSINFLIPVPVPVPVPVLLSLKKFLSPRLRNLGRGRPRFATLMDGKFPRQNRLGIRSRRRLQLQDSEVTIANKKNSPETNDPSYLNRKSQERSNLQTSLNIHLVRTK